MDGNLLEQQDTQSLNLDTSVGQLPTQVFKSLPSSPPVQESPPSHLSVQTLVHTSKSFGSLGHMPMHAASEPPGQSPEGVGVGGIGDGTGVGIGGDGIGVGGNGLQRFGSGPCTTLPVILRFLIVYTEDPRSPEFPHQSPGTQPTHCEE